MPSEKRKSNFCFGSVVQLVRMLPCHGRGRGFESRPVRLINWLSQNGDHFCFMYFVYIIKSTLDGTYYKGFSEDPYKRIAQHNAGESQYTTSKAPWELICLLGFDSKTAALIKEKKLKKYSTASLEALIKSGQNLLNQKGEHAALSSLHSVGTGSSPVRSA